MLCMTCISLSFAIYMTYGLCSYINYGHMFTDESMFSYYPKDQPAFQVGRLLFALLLAFSYPLQVLPFRTSFERLLMLDDKSKTIHANKIYIAMTSFIILLTLGISMGRPNLNNVGTFFIYFSIYSFFIFAYSFRF
jgi:hypothetical protein